MLIGDCIDKINIENDNREIKIQQNPYGIQMIKDKEIT